MGPRAGAARIAVALLLGAASSTSCGDPAVGRGGSGTDTATSAADASTSTTTTAEDGALVRAGAPERTTSGTWTPLTVPDGWADAVPVGTADRVVLASATGLADLPATIPGQLTPLPRAADRPSMLPAEGLRVLGSTLFRVVPTEDGSSTTWQRLDAGSDAWVDESSGLEPVAGDVTTSVLVQVGQTGPDVYQPATDRLVVRTSAGTTELADGTVNAVVSDGTIVVADVDRPLEWNTEGARLVVRQWDAEHGRWAPTTGPVAPTSRMRWSRWLAVGLFAVPGGVLVSGGDAMWRFDLATGRIEELPGATGRNTSVTDLSAYTAVTRSGTMVALEPTKLPSGTLSAHLVVRRAPDYAATEVGLPAKLGDGEDVGAWRLAAHGDDVVLATPTGWWRFTPS